MHLFQQVGKQYGIYATLYLSSSCYSDFILKETNGDFLCNKVCTFNIPFTINTTYITYNNINNTIEYSSDNIINHIIEKQESKLYSLTKQTNNAFSNSSNSIDNGLNEYNNKNNQVYNIAKKYSPYFVSRNYSQTNTKPSLSENGNNKEYEILKRKYTRSKLVIQYLIKQNPELISHINKLKEEENSKSTYSYS